MSTTATVTIDSSSFFNPLDAERAVTRAKLSEVQEPSEIIVNAERVCVVSDLALNELFNRLEDLHPGAQVTVVNDHTGDVIRHLNEREPAPEPMGTASWMTGLSDLQRAQLVAPGTVEAAARALDDGTWWGEEVRGGHPYVEMHRDQLRTLARAALVAALEHVTAEAAR